MLTALRNAAAVLSFHQIMAVTGDSANTASIGLHSALSFRYIGAAQNISFKFGCQLDIVYMQRRYRTDLTMVSASRHHSA